MNLSFTTLGCPQWDLDTIIRRAAESGYAAVDFRGVQETLDVTTLPAFTTGVAETKRKLADAGLAVSGISSSIQVCQAGKYAANRDEARRTIAVATALECPNVRIFGGKIDLAQRLAAAESGRKCVEAILALDGARDLHWLFETHDHWIRKADCQLLLDRIPNPEFGVLWDIEHTVLGGETPAETYAAHGQRIGYTHFKDAVRDSQGEWHGVLPGTGELPLAEAVRVLKAGGYTGYLVFEHEKRWQPSLPEPEVALPAFVRWARPFLCS